MGNSKSHIPSRSILRPILGVFAVVVLLGCVGCTYLYITIFAVDAASFEQGQERAGELLIALKQYEQDNGKFPAIVEDLVPKYLSAIPRPARRYEYIYDACSDGSGYILYFRLARSNDEWCGYSSGAEEWKCTDSIPPYYYDRPCNN